MAERSSDLKDAIAFIATYPPRQCGIGTFTSDLVRAVQGRTEGRLRTVVMAIDESEEDLRYPDEVQYTLNQHDNADYVRAAEFLNYNNVRAVSLQHEFGIFGGHDGAYALDLLRELRCPIITTFHTVLREPNEGQRQVMDELVVLSSLLVVMSERAVDFLRDVYGAPRAKIRLIHHGVPEIPLVEPQHYKAQFEMEGRELVLTFGLLNPGKGIEYALEALPPVVEEYPNLCYIVLGATHPNILREQGESYRLGLQRQARNLGLQKNVLFSDRFVSLDELCEFLKAADLYMTPYLNREQITSGTLAYALGAGKPIVSTRYWYAEELLADERGQLVELRDPAGLAEALLRLLGDPARVREMRANAYEFSRRMTWDEVGRLYLSTFREAFSTARVRASMPDVSMRHVLPITGLPRPRLDQLVRLTDDTGLLQHARFSVPNRAHGYCTDDNARALVVTSKYYDLFRSSEAERLLGTYLAFVSYAQRDDGLFHNFVSYDRQFQDEVGSDDCYGRALWGLGYAMYRGPRPYFNLVKEVLEQAASNLTALNLRGRSHAILGLYYYLQRYPEAEDIVEKIDRLAADHLKRFRAASSEDWLWFEEAIAYDNAVIPQSLFLAYEVTGNEDYHRVAQQSLNFIISMCSRGDHMSLVGNDGWHVRGGEPAAFDQQPIDACGLVEACKVAFRLTGRREYLRYMRMAFDWFLGVNDLGEPLYNFRTGGCSDGLTAQGANQNQGAESTLCFLLALLTLTDVFSEQDRAARGTAAGRAAGRAAGLVTRL
ncbi:MAG: glycosyltransferase family 4 protein [Planctomycetota bacterium]|jgi:glycosyltransferase involved in cell wall biosynthesis